MVILGYAKTCIIGILRTLACEQIAHIWEVAGKTQMAGAGSIRIKNKCSASCDLSVKFNPIIFVTYP